MAEWQAALSLPRVTGALPPRLADDRWPRQSTVTKRLLWPGGLPAGDGPARLGCSDAAKETSPPLNHVTIARAPRNQPLALFRPASTAAETTQLASLQVPRGSTGSPCGWRPLYPRHGWEGAGSSKRNGRGAFIEGAGGTAMRYRALLRCVCLSIQGEDRRDCQVERTVYDLEQIESYGVWSVGVVYSPPFPAQSR